MVSKLAIPKIDLTKGAPAIAMLLTLAAPLGLAAKSPTVGNPSYVPQPKPVVIDLSGGKRALGTDVASESSFEDLDRFARPDPTPHETGDRKLPEGLVQVGGMVVPEEMLDGADMVPDHARVLASDPDPVAWGPEDFCAFPDDVPPGVYDYDPRPGGETPRFHTVFLNYNGGVLNTGAENSAENLSQIALSGHQYPVYGGGEEKAIAVAQAVQNDLADWAVRVVYLERPPKVLPYTMVMIGGSYTDTTAGPSGGVAPLDCEDFGQRNVCYAFQNGAPASLQANVASQEIGHTLGLGHTQAPNSVMAAGYAMTDAGDLGFSDTCTETINVQGQGAACVGVNKCHCGGDGHMQNDKATLFATFSPAGPDITPPTIELLSPADGDVFAPGEMIHVEFEPWDDVGGYGWKLEVTDMATGELVVDQVDYDRALVFDLVGVPEGDYQLRALIQDHADQTDEDIITISVRVPGADDGADESGDGGSSGGDAADGMDDGSGSAGEDGTGGDAGGDGADGGNAVDPEGCSCSNERPAAPIAALFSVVLLGLHRRR